MENLTIIDADSCCYQLVWKWQDTSTPEMQHQVNLWVENILFQTNATHYLGFLGGVGNFRKEVAVSRKYKGTRKEDPESVTYWKPIIKAHLVDRWGFTLVDGQEADDACAVAHSLYSQEYAVTVAHVDWDLDQIPGKHFNYGRGEHYSLTPFQASYNFWHQMGTGCSGDEVPGINKWGPVKMTNLLRDCEEEWQMGNAVLGKYLEIHSQDYYTEQYTLLKLLTEETYGFICPQPLPVPTVSEPVLESIDHLFA